MKARPSYKPTFLDRHGPEGALRIRAAAYAFSVAGIILSVCIARGAPLIVTLLLALTLPPFAFAGTLWLSSGAGRVMRHMMEGGSSTPYEDQYTREQALVMQRNNAAALESCEEPNASTPPEARVRNAAADELSVIVSAVKVCSFTASAPAALAARTSSRARSKSP